MSKPQDIDISDYSYALPQDQIAKFPLENRASSRLLIYKNKVIQEDSFDQISNYIPEGSLMIFNESKVIPARLYLTSNQGKTHEVFCLEPKNGDFNSPIWNCLAKGLRKNWQTTLTASYQDVHLTAEVLSKNEGIYQIQFQWQGRKTFLEALETLGQIPIPPYLGRDTEDLDRIRYQTVYATNEGSVAAPTAGLHFTPQLLDELSRKKVKQQFVSLHVGAGTFQPVKSQTMADHEMHQEWLDVSRQTIQQLVDTKQNDKLIISVGTTSLRTIESLYWMGVKLMENPKIKNISELEIKQWDVYELPQFYTTIQALNALLAYLDFNNFQSVKCRTQLLITPNYSLKVADVLATNFHQPNSTLLLLVASILKQDWLRVYEYALNHGFRFLSYGDTSLLFNSH